MPYFYKKLFPKSTDSIIYCGKQSLGLHLLRHKDVSLDKFQNMQNIINRVEELYFTNDESKTENKQRTYAFVYKQNDGKKTAVLIRPDRNGKLIFWKSIHIVNEKQKKWKKINLARLKQGLYKSVEDAIPSIHQTLNASSSRRFSAFTDSIIITDTVEKSNQEAFRKRKVIHH